MKLKRKLIRNNRQRSSATSASFASMAAIKDSIANSYLKRQMKLKRKLIRNNRQRSSATSA
ncbi:hypothetical protein DXB51_28600, partial [Bacillus cereus]